MRHLPVETSCLDKLIFRPDGAIVKLATSFLLTQKS